MKLQQHKRLKWIQTILSEKSCIGVSKSGPKWGFLNFITN